MTGDTNEQGALWSVAAALLFFLSSCAGGSEFYREVDVQVAGGNHLKAVEAVRNNQYAYGDNGSVLFDLDLGLLYHYAGMPDSSNAHFFAAEKQIQELYTQSISLAALSTLTNDYVLPYDGEDFEKVLVNVFLALNYVEKGEPDEALVEARKVDLKLRQYGRDYQGKNRYQDDAFIRYIAGALYESAGEVNDAFISYRKAFEAYTTYAKEYATPTPSFLLDDLVRTATLLSFGEEAATYAALGGRRYEKSGEQQGSILVIVYSGKGPLKEEVRTTVSIPDTAGTVHTFQLALPRFVPRRIPIRGYDVTAQRQGEDDGAETSVHAELAEDVTAIAGKALEDRLAFIYLKSGGRALMKFLAAEKAKAELKKKNNEVANLLGSIAVDLAVAVTERADLRGWRTLPGEFQLARLNLLPGEYRLRIEAADGGKIIPGRPVTVKRGATSFVIIDDVR
jgi:uncharacterized protein